MVIARLEKQGNRGADGDRGFRLKRYHYWLLAIFLVTVVFRLCFAYGIEGFGSDQAYFHQRHIDHILEEKGVLYYDELSYSGRHVLYPPLFHMVMAILRHLQL